MARPNGDLDWVPVTDEFMRFANDYFRSADGIVFGRRVYEGFRSFWESLDPNHPSVTEEAFEFGEIFRT